VGLEPTIPVFKRAKTFYALDRAAAVIGPLHDMILANSPCNMNRSNYVRSSYGRLAGGQTTHALSPPASVRNSNHSAAGLSGRQHAMVNTNGNITELQNRQGTIPLVRAHETNIGGKSM
jgi:hypothetical protein